MRIVIGLSWVIVATAGPVAAQDGAVRISASGEFGWLVPTGTLASTNPQFAMAGRRGSAEPGPILGLALHADFPAPIPQLRLSIDRLLGADLIVEDSGGSESLGAMSLTTVLLEALIVPIRAGSFATHVGLGGGLVRYGFPVIPDEDLAPLFEDGTISPAVSVGLGGTWEAGRFTFVVNGSDVISTFDSPPVDSQTSPGETVDIDEVQHDLRFSVRARYPLWGW